MAFSGVNPTDWKSRSTADPGPRRPDAEPGRRRHVDAVGEGVDPVLVGERVWIWEAAYQRAFGTAAEYTVVPAGRPCCSGDEPSFELGAALGIPFLTAHRCLTLAESLPDRSAPGSLTGHDRARAGRRRGRRQRGDPAGPLGRRDRAHHGEQPGEGRSWPRPPAPTTSSTTGSRTSSPRSARSRRTGVDAIVEVQPAR